MARLIPSEPAGQVTPAVARMFRIIKALPESFTAWFSLHHAEEPKPHFLLVWEERHAFVIQVAETSQQLAESALQRDFLTENDTVLTADNLGREETLLLAEFTERVNADLGLAPGAVIPLRRLVVFPNVAQSTIDEIVLQRSAETQTPYLGCCQLGEERFARRLMELALDTLPTPSLAVFRKHFTPESVLPPDFNPLSPPERRTEAVLTQTLIDFDQEAVAKADLALPPEGEDLVRDLNTRLVTGVAGSGKSLVLLIRTLLMARLHGQARILVLTHNRPLNGELRRRFQRLTGHWPHFEWMTYFQWVRRCLPAEAWPERILSGQTLETLIKEIRPRHPALNGLSLPFLIDELNWIKDQRLASFDVYQNAGRQGRGIPLSSPLRKAMWRFFRDYQLALEREGATDWSGVALRLWKRSIAEKSLVLPVYDGVFADEAQFFAPAWFDCVKAAVRPGGQLFLCADPTQGFLRRRQSWLASGIDVRGRTVKLGVSYRNSQPILNFAARFYRQRLDTEDADDEAVNLPTPEQLAQAPASPHRPLILHCGSPQDTLTRLVNEIVALARQELRPASILVLHRQYTVLEAIDQRLKKTLGPGASQILQQAARPDPECLAGLSTLNAGTGLEAPIVFVLGLDELFEREEDLTRSVEERQALRRDHTRQIYMAMTRAAQRLVILCHRQATVEMLNLRTPDIPPGHLRNSRSTGN